MSANMASPATVTALMEKYQLKARKKYGQNFLVSPQVVEKVAQLISPDSRVLEIGPGLGALSKVLCERCSEYRGYEIDEDLVAVLKNELPQLNIIQGDFLEAELPEEGIWTVVSNLPYYITSDLLWKIFTHAERFDDVIVMVQKEVAQKFLAKNKGKDYNALAVLMDYYSDGEPVCQVSRHLFIPQPNVDSAVVRFRIKKEPRVYDSRFIRLVEESFTQPRKKLLTNLKELGVTEQHLAMIGLPETVRGQQMSCDDYVRLYEVMYEDKGIG